MGFGSQYVSSPGGCFSTEDYNQYVKKHCHKIDDDDEKNIPNWFYLAYCDEGKNIETLQTACVHINSYKKSHYHANNVDM